MRNREEDILVQGYQYLFIRFVITSILDQEVGVIIEFQLDYKKLALKK